LLYLLLYSCVFCVTTVSFLGKESLGF
jgi:hypothetical protein